MEGVKGTNMSREEIIKELKKYFDIKELVCNHIYDKFGE